jgi:hypothetical protein
MNNNIYAVCNSTGEKDQRAGRETLENKSPGMPGLSIS